MIELVGLVIFVIGIFINRVIMTNALSRLSDEEKLRLINQSPKINLYTSAALILFLVAYVASFYVSTRYVYFETTALYAVLFITVAVLSVIKYKRLVAMSLSINYIKSYLFATTFVVAGLIIMCIINIYPLLPIRNIN
jgi:hypothetical protein